MRWTVNIKGGGIELLYYPKAVCIGEKIYSISITTFRKDEYPFLVHVLDTSTLRWALVKNKTKTNDPMHFKTFISSGYTAVAYGDKIYVWGGRNPPLHKFYLRQSLSCFETKTLQWSTHAVTGILPKGENGRSACIVKNKMYIFGRSTLGRTNRTVHCLDLDTMQCRFINDHGTPPSPKLFQTAIAYFDRIYIFGGEVDFLNIEIKYNDEEKINCCQIYYFDTIAETWVATNPIGTRPETRKDHSAWLYNDYIYIFGGMNIITNTLFNDLYRYSIKGNFWECLNIHGVGPYNRTQVACSVYKDKVYFFGGELCRLPPWYRVETNMDLHVLDYAPTLKTLCILCVLEHNLDHSSLPHDIILDIRMMSTPNRNRRPKPK